MAVPGHLFGPFSLLEARVIPRLGGKRPPARAPGYPRPIGRATCPSAGLHGKGPGICCRALVLR